MTDINWIESLAEAREKAAESGKPLMTYFWAPG